MLLSLILYGYLLVLFHCLDTLTLNITNTNNQKCELGTIDTNNIIIFNADKTGVYNFTDKSMTYLSKTFSIYENVYLPITGEVNNKKYVFGGKDVISIVDGKVNEYSSISQTGYLYASCYDDDNKINGFFMFYSTSSSS